MSCTQSLRALRAIGMLGLVATFLCFCFAQPAAAQTTGKGVWISHAEIKALPMSGSAWKSVLSAANKTWLPQISHNTQSDTGTYAQALAYVRTGNAAYRQKVLTTLNNLPGAELGSNALSVGRSIPCYVIAADLVGFDSRADELKFKTWLVAGIRDKPHLGPDGSNHSLVTAHRTRPNNWGAMCGAARVAIDVYVGDFNDLQQAAQVYHGYIGNRAAYSGFKYGDSSWQANSKAPVGINPAGATKDGRDIGGCQPDDQRRSGSFDANRWPPARTSYCYEALQGLWVQAVILNRWTGIQPLALENRALLRAFDWQYRIVQYPPEGDDQWLSFLTNKYYGTYYPTNASASAGKVMAWTPWTHAK